MAFFNFPTAKTRDVLFSEVSGTSTTLRGGQIVVADTAGSGVNLASQVTRASLSNLHRPAYLVHPSSDGRTTDQKLKVIPLTDIAEGRISVWTDQSITAGDILGPQPNTHVLRRGALFTPYAFRALETVDRSSTAGLVTCDVIPNMGLQLYRENHLDFYEDFTSRLWHSYLDSVDDVIELTDRGWTVIKTTGTALVNNASVAGGGSVALTTAATDDTSVNLVHGINAPTETAGVHTGGVIDGSGFVISAGNALLFDARVTVTDAAATGNMHVGMLGSAASSTITASGTVPMQTTGGGPPADYDGFNFHKVDGGVVWQAEAAESTGATEDTDTNVGAFATATAYRMQILYNGSGSILFFLDGTLVHTSTTLPISSANLSPAFHCRAGSAQATTLRVHYCKVIQAKAQLT